MELAAELLNALAQVLVPIGVIVTAIYAYKAKGHAKEASKQSTEANDAVNHTHRTQPRIFDLVLANSHKTEYLVEEMRAQRERLEEATAKATRERAELRERLENHIDWEVDKYLMIDTIRAPLEGEKPTAEDPTG